MMHLTFRKLIASFPGMLLAVQLDKVTRQYNGKQIELDIIFYETAVSHPIHKQTTPTTLGVYQK